MPPVTKKQPELIYDYQHLLNSNEIDIEELTETTSLLAQSFFEDSGVIVNVIDKDGKQVEYIPSEESIKLRRDMLQVDALIKHQAKSLQRASIMSSIILLLSIPIGLFSTKLFDAYSKAFKK